MTFTHHKTDIMWGCRFRADTWHYIEERMHSKSHLSNKSVHQVLDEIIREAMKR